MYTLVQEVTTLSDMLSAFLAIPSSDAPARVLSAAQANGLPLTSAQARALCQSQSESLERTGRVDLGGGILPALIEHFADSPHIQRDAWTQTLRELTELFYAFKNTTRDTLSDGELLLAMSRLFDGPAQGSLLALADASPNALRHAAQNPHGLRLLDDGEDEPSDDEEGAAYDVD